MTENEYIVDGEMAFLVIKNESHGVMSFLIDTEDIEKLQKYTWLILRCHHTDSKALDKYYAKASKASNLLIHRYLTDAPKGTVVNHRTGNTFDMRKKNLMVGTYAENNRNVINRRNNSGRVGVTYITSAKKWQAYIGLDGDRLNLGNFENKEDAIRAREEAELKYYGKLAVDRTVIMDMADMDQF